MCVYLMLHYGITVLCYVMFILYMFTLRVSLQHLSNKLLNTNIHTLSNDDYTTNLVCVRPYTTKI